MTPTQQPVAADLTLPFAIFPDELAALHRFYETTEDGQDYDVPVPMMKRLAVIGLVRRVTGNRYEFTDFGLSVRNGDFAAALGSAPATPVAASVEPCPHADECNIEGECVNGCALRGWHTPSRATPAPAVGASVQTAAGALPPVRWWSGVVGSPEKLANLLDEYSEKKESPRRDERVMRAAAKWIREVGASVQPVLASLSDEQSPVEHQGMTIAGDGAAMLGALMREQHASRLGVYPDGNPNAFDNNSTKDQP